jgi:hypothetical protein
MKERSTFSKAIALVAVLAGVLAVASVDAAQKGQAAARTVVGKVEYSLNGVNGPWTTLMAGDQLNAGSTVRTANDSSVVLFLDQNGPLVRLSENTILGIDKLDFDVTSVDTVIETQLDLKAGRIFGITKRMSATSKYEVKTPNGVAGIRGTVYAIKATGEIAILEGSAVVVSVSSDGTVTTQSVGAGEKFYPSTGEVVPMSDAEKARMAAEKESMVQVSEPILVQQGDAMIFISPITE